MTIAKEMDEAIVKHFEIPPEVQRQASYASQDLYYGPYEAGHADGDDGPPYLGFTKACALVSEWCDDNLSEVWYDIQSGEVLDREPEGYYDGEDIDENGTSPWIEPSWEDYYHCGLNTVKRALFVKELVQYI